MKISIPFLKGKKKEEEKGHSFTDALKAEVRLRLLERRMEAWKKLTVKLNRDEPSYAHMIEKTALWSSLAHGEMGDRFKITKNAQVAWKNLVLGLLSAEETYGKDHPLTQTLLRLVYLVALDFTHRSVSSKHTDVEIVTPPLDFFGLRYRRDSLARV